MSSTKVLVQVVESVEPHLNADTLSLYSIAGWQLVGKNGNFEVGDHVAYFEPGTVLPKDVADFFGITQYLRRKTDMDGNNVLVVDKIRLRGEPSFGFATKVPSNIEPLTDVSEAYGASKYMPPVKITRPTSQSQIVTAQNPLFARYTDIENARNYSKVFKLGEEVVVTEKIHGTNSRVAYVRDDESGEKKVLVGSRRYTRDIAPEGQFELYSMPLNIAGVRNILEAIWEIFEPKRIIIYGEIYGPTVQPYGYGTTGFGYVCFDISVDGKYLDYDDLRGMCRAYNIPMAPEVWRGPFSLEKIKELSGGPSLLAPNAPHQREGVVVRPIAERTNPKVGRVILKYISDEFLFSKAVEAADTTDA